MQTKTDFKIHIIDDGIGFSDEFKNGNGLTNMVLRMENIDGKFEIIPSENVTHLFLILTLES